MNRKFKELVQDKEFEYVPMPGRYLEKLGCSKYTYLLQVTTCTEFRDVGIRDGSDVYFDPDIPYKEGEVSAFVRMNTELDCNEFKLSRTKLDGYIYAGQLVLIVTAVKGIINGKEV